jgi:hypothetical protein
MPQVLVQNGFRVMIYPDDHRPAHLHIYKSGLIVIRLNNRRTPPSIREVIGMSRKEARDALLLVTEHKKVLVKEWRKIHVPATDE